MAQINPGDLTIDPTVVDGTDLAARLERFYAAEASQNSGPSRPASLKAGGIWAKTGQPNSPELYLFDGTNDVLIVDNRGSSSTLDDVTGNGNTTTNDITVGNLTSKGIDDNATSTAITILASGKVGIGTASPLAKLDCFAGSLSVGSTYVSTLNTDYRIQIRSVGPAANNNYSAQIGLAGGTAFPSDTSLVFYTQNWTGATYEMTEKMRIDNLGSVGIGGTPGTGAGTIGGGAAKLQVNGSAFVSGLVNALAIQGVVSGKYGLSFNETTDTIIQPIINGAAIGGQVSFGNAVRTFKEAWFSGSVMAAGTALTSDSRLKSNIADEPVDLSAFASIKTKRYDMNGENQIGILAQDLEAKFPDAVTTSPVHKAWDASKDYVEGQEVEHNGKLYQALSDVTTGIKPDDIWQDEVAEVPAIEARDAVLDEDGNEIEPAVAAVPGMPYQPASGGWKPTGVEPQKYDNGDIIRERKFISVGPLQAIITGAVGQLVEENEKLKNQLNALMSRVDALEKA